MWSPVNKDDYPYIVTAWYWKILQAWVRNFKIPQWLLLPSSNCTWDLYDILVSDTKSTFLKLNKPPPPPLGQARIEKTHSKQKSVAPQRSISPLIGGQTAWSSPGRQECDPKMTDTIPKTERLSYKFKKIMKKYILNKSRFQTHAISLHFPNTCTYTIPNDLRSINVRPEFQ